jgi:hypothetical protein
MNVYAFLHYEEVAMTFTTYNQIEQEVVSKGGVRTFEMWELRDVHGAGKLGRHVAAGISEELADKGLGHLPAELPISQYERARVFKLKSPVGRMILATTTLTDEADDTLRSTASDNAEATLKKIRELIC